MPSYIIYLTKSSQVAHLIAHARSSAELRTEDIKSVSHSAVGNDERIPAIYHNKGYYCCVVEMKNDINTDKVTYELTIC